MTGGKNDIDWYCSQIHRVLDDKIQVHWFTTNSAPLENYNNANATERLDNTRSSSFLRTWFLDFGRGEASTTPSKPSRILKDIYSGRIPLLDELNDHLLVRNVGISMQGKLDSTTLRLRLAAKLKILHHMSTGGEDDFLDKEAFHKRVAKQQKRKHK